LKNKKGAREVGRVEKKTSNLIQYDPSFKPIGQKK